MAYYNKIGLLILNDKRNVFLVCKKRGLAQYIMPGGKLEAGENDLECLKREAREELNCMIKAGNIKLIGEYLDISAEGLNRDIFIRLYQGEIIGQPTASAEIIAIHWITKEDINNQKLSPIIKNKIIPDLISRKILN